MDGMKPPQRGCQMKTLIVEDEFSSRWILQNVANRYGTCFVAVNGKEGVAAFKSARNSCAPFDLVLMDVMMDEMNGLEALKEIRRIEEADGISGGDGIKVVMITGLNKMAMVSQSYQNYCDDYLVKPIDPGRLIASLKTLNLSTA